MIQEFTLQNNPALDHVKAFRDAAQQKLLVIASSGKEDGATLAMVQYNLVRNQKGEVIETRADVGANLRRFDELFKKIKVNPLYREVIIATIVKEGATLVDMLQSPILTFGSRA